MKCYFRRERDLKFCLVVYKEINPREKHHENAREFRYSMCNDGCITVNRCPAGNIVILDYDKIEKVNELNPPSDC